MMEILIAGRLLRDPATKTGPSGKPYTTALVKTPMGTKGEESIVVSVIAFEGEAERLGRLRAGDAVSVAGSAKVKTWEKDGEVRPGMDVVASSILTAYDARKRRGSEDAAPNPARRSAGNGGRAGPRSDDWAPYDDPLNF